MAVPISGVGIKGVTKGGVAIPSSVSDNSWSDLSYDDLLGDLRRDLQLDATTDLAGGTFLQAMRQNALPFGAIAYPAISLTAPNGYAIGQNATAGFAAGGMVIKNQGGARGWEIVAPYTGWYRYTFQSRVDLGSAGYNAINIMVNGAQSTGLGYGIESPNTVPYHNHNLQVFAALNVGDAVNLGFGDGAGGTVVLGQNLGSWMMLQWVSPTGTRVF